MKGTGRGRALAVAGTTALAPISWGTTYIVVTELLPGGRPLLLAAVRVVPAGLALLALAAVRSRRRPPPVRRPDHRWWQTGVLALCNFGVFFPLLAVAVYRLPGGVAAAAGGLQPLLVAGGTLVAGGGRPRGRDLAVGVVAAAGVGLVVIRPGAGLDPVGVLAAVGANLSFGAGVVLTRRFPAAGGDRLAATGRQLLAGGVVLVPLALAVEGAPPPPTAASLAGFAYLSLAATALAFVLWFDGIRRLPAVAPPLLGLAAPVTGAAIGWVALGQALSPVQLAGFAVTLGAIAHGATRGASEAPESVAVPLRAVDRGGQLLGCQQAVAVRDELPHLRPVDRVVDHHPHRAGRGAGPEERMAGADEHIELRRCRAEQQERVRTSRRVDGQHVGERALTDAPAGARPRRVLPRLRQRQADRPQPGDHLGGHVGVVGHPPPQPRGCPRTWDTTSSGTGGGPVAAGYALAGKPNTPSIGCTG
jgi:probable blue pigment (indigoidine) exporter